jgi:class 3 adenylate cyclase
VHKQLFPSAGAPQRHRNTSDGLDDTSPTTPIVGSPIAQTYPETTVLFADIVGFTAWSSLRDPIQVFHLLETLYAGFDELARKYGVFKIETIGDCYVAVVGFPKSQKNHAIIMVHFANAICAKVIELTHKLADSLGPVSKHFLHFVTYAFLLYHS